MWPVSQDWISQWHNDFILLLQMLRMFDCDSLPCFILNISTGGEGVKIGIGNISNAAFGHNAGDIGVGNNCNVSGESCVWCGWEGNCSYNDVETVSFTLRSSFDSLCSFFLSINRRERSWNKYWQRITNRDWLQLGRLWCREQHQHQL